MAKVIEARELGFIDDTSPPRVVVSLRFYKDRRLLAVRIRTYPLATLLYDICDMLRDEYGADEVNYQPLLSLE